MAEVAKQLPEHLYPEVAEAGSLRAALQRELDQLFGDFVLEESEAPIVAYARAKSIDRSSRVMLAVAHRSFSVGFWHQGVQVGHGWTASLSEVARAIHAFHHACALPALVNNHAWVSATPDSALHNKGAAHLVAATWADLESWLQREALQMRALLPLVVAAVRRPRLRQLMPFTSMNRLCFSRTTGYPYTDDCPIATPDLAGTFTVQGRDGTRFERCDPERAADLMVTLLPPDCGPAVHGTAEDLEERSSREHE